MIEVNLLPEHQREKAGGKRSARRPSLPSFRRFSFGEDPWLTGLIVALVLVPVLALTLWLVQRAEARELDERLTAATADSARLADLRAVSDSLSERRQLIRERMSLIERLDRDRFVWPRVMDEVSRALPEIAWLTNVRQLSPLPEMTFQLQGIAGNPLAITDFVRNLQASPYIGEVRIMGSQQQEVEGLSVQAFTLVARYRHTAELERRAPIVPTGD